MYVHNSSLWRTSSNRRSLVCLTKLPSTRTGDADFDSENGGGITVAARGFQINSPMPIGKPSDIDKCVVLTRQLLLSLCLYACFRVLRWVIEYPLATINHMMHLVHPETVDYILQEGRNDGHDNALIRWAYWGRDENTITEALDTWSESVMVFIQPPWILTQADMEAFVGCPTVRGLFCAVSPHCSRAETVSGTKLTKEIEELREAVGKGGLHNLLRLP